MQPSVLIDGHRVMSWNAYVLLRRCSGRSDGEGGSEGGGGGGSEGGGGGGGEGPGSSGKGELHVRWMCVEVVAGAVAAVVAVVVSWSVDFSCCDVPLSRCLCAVVLSRKMFISAHVACYFAHAAFLMVQWRIFLNCLL